MEANPNITRLLEMLENPEAYSEQEIRDIINHDDETREAYRLMVTAKQGYTHKQSNHTTNAQAAWKRFCENEERRMKNEESYGREPMARADSSFFTLHSSFQKIVASFMGILLISSITFAAIHIVRKHQKQKFPQTEQMVSEAKTTNTIPVDTLTTDTTTVQPVIYDNIPLEKMLSEIAAYYSVDVMFQNNEIRSLRFHFVWNPQQEIEKVVSDLNHFERLHVMMKENQLIVE